MVKYNIEKIIKIRVNEQRKSFFYRYKKEKKFLGFVIQKEGFYTEYYRSVYIGKDIPDHIKLIDGIAYEKPSVEIYYENAYAKEYHFDNYDEAIKFMEKITLDRSRTWID